MLALIGVLTVTAVVYWPGLSGPFLFDDGPNLRPLNDWLTGHTGWLSVVLENRSGLFGRPISMATFVANVAMLGASPWALKLGNLLIHLINGILVYGLFAALLQRGALLRDADRDSRWIACLGASIWLLHPLLVSTVLYVVQRMAMLSTLFTLLTLLAYLYGRTAWQEQRKRSAVVLLGLGVPLCTMLAVLSKENGALAPALCAIVELIVFRPTAGVRRSIWSSAFIVLTLVLPAFTAVVLMLMQSPFITAGYSDRAFSLTERLLTEARVLWDYVFAIVLPGGQHLGFYHDDFPISRGLFTPTTTVLAICGWLAAMAAAWRLRDKVPGLALGLGIFLIGQALESSVFPLMIYFEHRNYLPAIGIIWAALSMLAAAARQISPMMRQTTPVFSAAALMLVSALIVGTSTRATVWASERGIITEALQFHPSSTDARLHSILWALYQDPPAIITARRDADWLRQSASPNARRIGTVTRVLIDCRADGKADPMLVQQMFSGHAGPYEQNLIQSFELLSDAIAERQCMGLSPAQMADGLSRMLDRWEQETGTPANWRLRLRTANLYMAADRNPDAIEQAKMAYYKGRPPIDTALRIASILINCGNSIDSSRILDVVEQRLRPSDWVAFKIIADDRAKLRELEQARSAPSARQQ
jgi:hypothetical protein